MMYACRRAAALITVVLLIVSTGAGTVVAQPVTETPTPEQGEDEEEDDEETIVNIELDKVVEAIEDLTKAFNRFTLGLGETVTESITLAIMHPFKRVASKLVTSIATVLTTTPSVYPNQPVEEVHRQTLIVALLLSTLGFMIAGILHMVGPILGVSYQRVRMILPRLLIADIFAATSLPLLQLAVEFTNALSTAFAPSQLYMSITQLSGLSVGLVIVWLVQSLLLLALVALFILRDVYILFGAAISPLLAVMWSLPKTKKYADTFIGSWYAALIIAPLDLLVLKLALALMDGSGQGLDVVANWMFGIATFSLLLIVPYQVWTTSGTAVRETNSIFTSVKNRVKKIRNWTKNDGKPTRRDGSGSAGNQWRRRR